MIFSRHYISFIEDYLGDIPNIKVMINYLNIYPRIVDIYKAELLTALELFQKYKNNEFSYPNTDEICINARYLATLLQKNDLPTFHSIEKHLFRSERTPEIAKVGDLLKSFEFISTMEAPNILSAALFLGFYRTYALITMPMLMEKEAQVASSLEEMLAILAFEGCKTQLFFSTYHWIVDYKVEGFSEALAIKVIELIKHTNIT